MALDTGYAPMSGTAHVGPPYRLHRKRIRRYAHLCKYVAQIDAPRDSYGFLTPRPDPVGVWKSPMENGQTSNVLSSTDGWCSSHQHQSIAIATASAAPSKAGSRVMAPSTPSPPNTLRVTRTTLFAGTSPACSKAAYVVGKISIRNP